MGYWVMGKINGAAEAVSVASARQAAKEVKRYTARGARNLRIIGPDRKPLTMHGLERSLLDGRGRPH
jgi:hypothetical protein